MNDLLAKLKSSAPTKAPPPAPSPEIAAILDQLPPGANKDQVLALLKAQAEAKAQAEVEAKAETPKPEKKAPPQEPRQAPAPDPEAADSGAVEEMVKPTPEDLAAMDGPKTPPKKKRGRPRKKKAEPAPEPAQAKAPEPAPAAEAKPGTVEVGPTEPSAGDSEKIATLRFALLIECARAGTLKADDAMAIFDRYFGGQG